MRISGVSMRWIAGNCSTNAAPIRKIGEDVVVLGERVECAGSELCPDVTSSRSIRVALAPIVTHHAELSDTTHAELTQDKTDESEELSS